MNIERIETIETERTVGRRVTADDLGLLYRMYTNEEVMYPLGGTRTFAESRDFVQRMIKHWEDYGFGVFVFFEKITQNFIGRCGFKKNNLEGKDEIELLYATMPTFWGKGYGSEIAKKLVQLGFEQLGFTEIVSFTSVTNKASVRVMEKAGFKFEKNFIYQNDQCAFYRVKKS